MASFDPRLPVLADNPSEWTLVAPDVLAALTPRNGILTAAQHATIERIARSRWFLLRNRGNAGQSYKCRRCGAVHDYFTLHCVDRPFNGLTQAVGVLTERVGDGQSTDISVIALGAIEPITRDRARKLYTMLRNLGYDPAELLGEGGVTYSAADRRRMAG